MSLMFIIYELKKPWKDMVYPSDDFDETAFFEPRTIINSRKTDYLRYAIVTMIGFSIALVVFTGPVYDDITGEVTGNPELFGKVVTLCIPTFMVIIIILFAFYIRSKNQDWENYLKELEEQGKPLPRKISIDDDPDSKVVGFGWQRRFKR